MAQSWGINATDNVRELIFGTGPINARIAHSGSGFIVLQIQGGDRPRNGRNPLDSAGNLWER